MLNKKKKKFTKVSEKVARRRKERAEKLNRKAQFEIDEKKRNEDYAIKFKMEQSERRAPLKAKFSYIDPAHALLLSASEISSVLDIASEIKKTGDKLRRLSYSIPKILVVAFSVFEKNFERFKNPKDTEVYDDALMESAKALVSALLAFCAMSEYVLNEFEYEIKLNDTLELLYTD